LSTAVGLFQSVVGVIFLFGANALAKKFGDRGIW
jgi:putative aldouronate transport system permease protein